MVNFDRLQQETVPKLWDLGYVWRTCKLYSVGHYGVPLKNLNHLEKSVSEVQYLHVHVPGTTVPYPSMGTVAKVCPYTLSLLYPLNWR